MVRSLLNSVLLLSTLALVPVGCADSGTTSSGTQDIGGADLGQVAHQDGGAPADLSRPPDETYIAPGLPVGSPALMGHVSGAGVRTSPNYQLRLSVGAPVGRADLSSPSYSLHIAAPWPASPEP